MNYLVTLIVSGLFVSGVAISLLFKHTDNYIQFFLSSALGFSGTLIMVELLPDAIEKMNANYDGQMRLVLIMGYILVGMIVMKVIDVFLPDHDRTKDNKKNYYAHIGLMVLLPIIIYNIVAGMKIAMTFESVNYAFGLGICNFLFGFLLSGLFSKLFTNKLNLFLTLLLVPIASTLGVMLYEMLSASIDITDGIIVLVSALSIGSLIYVAIAEEFNQLLKFKKTYITALGIVVGICLLF